jgi:hypothetical protein
MSATVSNSFPGKVSEEQTPVKAVFSKDTYELVQKLAEVTSSKPGDVIRDAIGLYRWAMEERLKGNHIATVKDGKIIGRAYFPADDSVLDSSDYDENIVSKLWPLRKRRDKRVTL